jgi:hypothetical protein
VGAVIPALGKMRQEDLEFKANMGYIMRASLKKTKEIKVQMIGNETFTAHC